MRADGEQNRQKLLDAAEALFAAKGTSASVGEIVATAGVTPPTLYRHFGDKDGLIDAIAARRTEVVAANLGRALSQPTGWDGLRVALELSVDLARSNRAIREQQNGLPLNSSLERMLLTGWNELIERGHAEGSVRRDFTGADIPFLAVACVAASLAAEHSSSLRDRYIVLLMDSLRPESKTPLPGPGPSRRDVTRAFAGQRVDDASADSPSHGSPDGSTVPAAT